MFTCHTPDSQLLPIYPAIFKIMHTHNSIMRQSQEIFVKDIFCWNQKITTVHVMIILSSYYLTLYSLSLVGLNFKYRPFYDHDIGICLDFVVCAHHMFSACTVLQHGGFEGLHFRAFIFFT